MPPSPWPTNSTGNGLRAEQEYRRAIGLNPNYPTAHHWFCTYLYITGQLDNAEREIKRAEELDPLSPIISANLAIIFLLRNETEAAIDQCQKIIQLDPNHISGHDWLGWAYVKEHRYPEAIAEREKVAELSQRSGPQLAGLGYVYALSGRRAEALAILRELETRYDRREIIGQHLAAICYALGDKTRPLPGWKRTSWSTVPSYNTSWNACNLSKFATSPAASISSGEWGSASNG